jgi:hypothetical protein
VLDDGSVNTVIRNPFYDRFSFDAAQLLKRNFLLRTASEMNIRNIQMYNPHLPCIVCLQEDPIWQGQTSVRFLDAHSRTQKSQMWWGVKLDLELFTSSKFNCGRLNVTKKGWFAAAPANYPFLATPY